MNITTATTTTATTLMQIQAAAQRVLPGQRAGGCLAQHTQISSVLHCAEVLAELRVGAVSRSSGVAVGGVVAGTAVVAVAVIVIAAVVAVSVSAGVVVDGRSAGAVDCTTVVRIVI